MGLFIYPPDLPKQPNTEHVVHYRVKLIERPTAEDLQQAINNFLKQLPQKTGRYRPHVVNIDANYVGPHFLACIRYLAVGTQQEPPPPT